MSEAALLQVERLSRRFAVVGQRGSNLFAVDDVSFEVRPGESLGLVGESGCGKSTLVRLLSRLLDTSDGRIVFAGADLAEVPARRFARHAQRPAIQMVFQDPTESLNPRWTAFDCIADPIRRMAPLPAAKLADRVRELADEEGKAHLRLHMALAERWGKLYYATAGVAVLGLLAAWKWPRGFHALAVLAALLAVASLVAGAVIAEAGGKVRHPEFRTGPPAPEHHEDGDHDHTH